MAKAPAAMSARPARHYRLCLLALPLLAGCAGSPWKRDVMYSASGVVLYREQKEIEGKKVALGYKHPIELSADKAVLILSQMVFEESYLLKKSAKRYVFTPEQVRAFVPPLSVALKGIGPNDRLRFLVTESNWSDAFLGTTGTSGVAFSTEDGVLDFAFDRIQEKVAGAEEGNPAKVIFHGEPTENTDGDPLVPQAGTALRLDPATGQPFPRWLAVKVADVKPFAPAGPTSVGAPPKPPAPEKFPQVVVPERPPLGEPPAPPAGASAATPAPQAPPAPPSTPEEEARYREAKKRLDAIKRLRADGALTEEEYQKEYQKILAELGQKGSG
jgi:hypothetical protein